MVQWLFRRRDLDSRTAVLFARPSFIEGVSRIMDLTGTLSEYNQSETPQEADFNALWADWSSVGIDLTESICEHAETR